VNEKATKNTRNGRLNNEIKGSPPRRQEMVGDKSFLHPGEAITTSET
jgi:hypothetical protein